MSYKIKYQSVPEYKSKKSSGHVPVNKSQKQSGPCRFLALVLACRRREEPPLARRAASKLHRHAPSAVAPHQDAESVHNVPPPHAGARAPVGPSGSFEHRRHTPRARATTTHQRVPVQSSHGRAMSRQIPSVGDPAARSWEAVGVVSVAECYGVCGGG
jgi:hypothetical protein